MAADLAFCGSTAAAHATTWSPIGSPTHVVLFDHDGMTYGQGGPAVKGGPKEMWRERFDYRPIVGCRHHEL